MQHIESHFQLSNAWKDLHFPVETSNEAANKKNRKNQTFSTLKPQAGAKEMALTSRRLVV